MAESQAPGPATASPAAPLKGRSLFRPEVEQYRRLRHFGEISLVRPLPLRLVALVPLLVVAVLGFALSRLSFQPMFVALVEQAPEPGQGLRLSLEPALARNLRRGDEVELRLAGAAERSRGVIAELSTGPCSREARVFLLASSRGAEDGCLQLVLAPNPSLATPAAPVPLKAQLWAPPRKYLDQLLR